MLSDDHNQLSINKLGINRHILALNAYIVCVKTGIKKLLPEIQFFEFNIFFEKHSGNKLKITR
jgi:hypothetical protein